MLVRNLILLFSFLSFVSFAQDEQENQYTNAIDSDPAAISILESLKEKYEAMETMEIEFAIEIEIPEEDLILQEGVMSKKGEKFRLDMEDQSIISNGEILWFHLKKNNEVQINDASMLEEEDESFLTPDKMLKMYEGDEFIFVLSSKYSEGGKLLQEIECKPTDRDSDYSKMRIVVNSKKQEIDHIKAFSKDGSRYTFLSKQLTAAKAFDESHFEFNKADFPDIYVEDLRY